MPEFIYTAGEPTIIGTIDASKAQAYAESQKGVRKFPHERQLGWQQTKDLLTEFDINLSGLGPNARERFMASAFGWLEYLPGLLDHEDDGVNMWHPDYTTQTNGRLVFDPFRIVSSSHSTEIVCGDVKFKLDIHTSKGYHSYMSSEIGQQAVDDALIRGSAWLYEPEDIPLDGTIVQLNDCNLHRRNQSEPANPYRFAVRQFDLR